MIEQAVGEFGIKRRSLCGKIPGKTRCIKVREQALGESALKRWSRYGNEGFTLIELMVVIVILGILAAIIAPRVIGRTDEAKVTEAKVQIKNFDTAIKLYKIDNGRYPATDQGLTALIEKPSVGIIPKNWRAGGYLENRKIPKDPWGNPYLYASPGLNGEYDIISFGRDGVRGGEGYDGDVESWDIK